MLENTLRKLNFDSKFNGNMGAKKNIHFKWKKTVCYISPHFRPN